jgi:hypothetical protein
MTNREQYLNFVDNCRTDTVMSSQFSDVNYAATSSYPHIIGDGDAILYGTPAKNLIAIKEESEK